MKKPAIHKKLVSRKNGRQYGEDVRNDCGDNDFDDCGDNNFDDDDDHHHFHLSGIP